MEKILKFDADPVSGILSTVDKKIFFKKDKEINRKKSRLNKVYYQGQG
jgi:hypothetical protein